MKKFSILLTVISTLLIYSCSTDTPNKSVDSEINLIPYQLKNNGKWGYVDKNGTIKIDTVFEIEPGYFKDGFAIIKDWDGSMQYIDESGKTVSPQYAGATPFFEGFACVVEDMQPLKIINKKFEPVVELKDAIYAGVFSEGRAKIMDPEGKWGFIDKSGKIAIQPQFDYVSGFSDGLALATIRSEKGEQVFFIDTTGNIKIKFDREIVRMRKFFDGFAVFQDTTGWKIIDKEGKETALDKSWQAITDYYNGYSSFMKDSLWGAIDTEGKVVLEAKYTNPISFNNGLAGFVENKKIGFMDKTGKVIVAPTYDDVIMPYIGEFAFVKSNNEFTMIGLDQKPLTELKFHNVGKQFFSLFDTEQVLQDHRFYPDVLIKQLIPVITENEISGFTKETSSMEIISKFQINQEKLDMESSEIIIPFTNYTQDIGLSFVIRFNNKLSNPKSVFRSLEIMMAIVGNKSETKTSMVVQVLKNRLLQSKFTLKEENDKQLVYTSGNTTVTIMLMNSQIGLFYAIDK